MAKRIELTERHFSQIRRLGQRRGPTQAVILAAGRGSRLADFTRAKPKCLVEVGGATLLEHQLEALSQAGIQDVTIVAGYRADDVGRAVGRRARIVANDAWDSTNSLYSMALCRERVRGDMLVMNCDVLAHPSTLRRLLKAGPDAFLYDSRSGGADEEMKVELRQGRLAAMSKQLPQDRIHGENVGVLLFEAAEARSLFDHAADLLAGGHHNLWLAAAVERLVQTVPLRGVDIADLPWIEIDFPDDLERACRQVWPQVASAFSSARLRLAA